MEEDIKKLERYLNGDKIYDTELDNALRNLIARYKESEKENENLRDTNKKLYEMGQRQAMQILIEDDYIPKSKVKEKIDDLNIKMAEQLKIISEFGEHEKNRAKLTMYKEQRDILGELLEGDK